MGKLIDWIRNSKIFSLTGLLWFILFMLWCSYAWDFRPIFPIVICSLAVLVWTAVWWFERRAAQKSGEQISDMLQEQASKAVADAAPEKKDDIEAIRNRIVEVVKTIKTSKIGDIKGSAALYELPWYMVIGNPAAGKSSAIVNSGLNFPFVDENGVGAIVQGVGGTRNCDWFFTTEGILLDTAGRYSTYDESRGEWLEFLEILKKHRPKAPINGILITASVAELVQSKTETIVDIAKKLRQRVQELTENLGIFAPVYVLFTKVDLIPGFTEFFNLLDEDERRQAWGSTLPYSLQSKDSLIEFNERFEELFQGLKEKGVAQMARQHGGKTSLEYLSFPLEFASIKPLLQVFVSTLFEENPFQFKPIFRGFYFTSAVQVGEANSAVVGKISQQFSLRADPQANVSEVSSRNSLFLRDLFSKVIFADRHLVRQYTSKRYQRLRVAAFFITLGTFGLTLGAWTWSYMGNQQLVQNTLADFEKVQKMQKSRYDLASRLESLEILQDRIAQLNQFKQSKPLGLSFGLYQGNELEKKLYKEYFSGVREILLKPLSKNLEGFLVEVNNNAQLLQPTGVVQAIAPATQNTPYRESVPSNANDAYNALKTYLMLADREHLDPAHLNDQVTRFWRIWLEENKGDMPHEQMIRSAERILNFVLAQVGRSDFPEIDTRISLVEEARTNLRRVVKGTPARERVYNEIKLRASTRFPQVTVARIVGEDNKELFAGSHVVSGAFTYDAWDKYIAEAIKDSANKELQTSDWVLRTASNDDLTLEGSPEQIQKALTSMYKAEYVKEWKKFIQGVVVNDFGDFEKAVAAMNRLGDKSSSPMSRLINTLYRETSWDSPIQVPQGLVSQVEASWWQRVKNFFSFSGSDQIPIKTPNLTAGLMDSAQGGGVISREFSGLSRIMKPYEDQKDATMMNRYLDLIGKIRSRFNQIKNTGDIGLGSKALMQQTLSGEGSELAESLKFIDEQMFASADDTSKTTLRPILVRPLMQAFAVLIKPTEQELNKLWAAQVYQNYAANLGTKYPFSPDSRVEATPQEIAQIFSSEGAVAKFVDQSLGSLVVRRGDAISVKTWADMGVQIAPEFLDNYGRYIAGAGSQGNTAAAGSPSASAGEPQTRFQLQPLPTQNLVEYSIEVDGQLLRYRNGVQEWSNFVWPNPNGQPGAKINAVSQDGRVTEVFNEPGRFGLEKMISTAQRKKRAQGVFELSWSNGNATVTVLFKMISSPQVDGAGNNQPKQGLKGLKLPEHIAGI
jgi:type VI secretion system protein ImpL